MKFNKYVPKERRDFLEAQYKEYIRSTSMTNKEQRALREWVKDGNSVYENANGAWYDGQVPVEFLTVYRDEEYIRQHTKGMNPDEVKAFAMKYYGWEDERPSATLNEPLNYIPLVKPIDSDEELPFS